MSCPTEMCVYCVVITLSIRAILHHLSRGLTHTFSPGRNSTGDKSRFDRLFELQVKIKGMKAAAE